jgi:hypothetical protein
MYDFQLETWLTILELKYSNNDLKGDKPQEDMDDARSKPMLVILGMDSIDTHQLSTQRYSHFAMVLKIFTMVIYSHGSQK